MQEPRRLDSTNLYPSLLPLADLLDRPPCVFCDERFRVQGCALQRRQILFTADISQRDAHVSQKSPALDPFDWRIPKQVAKLSFIESQIIAQRESGGRSARPARTSRGKRGFVRNLSKAVPRTGI